MDEEAKLAERLARIAGLIERLRRRSLDLNAQHAVVWGQLRKLRAARAKREARGHQPAMVVKAVIARTDHRSPVTLRKVGVKPEPPPSRYEVHGASIPGVKPISPTRDTVCAPLSEVALAYRPATRQRGRDVTGALMGDPPPGRTPWSAG